MQSVSSINKYRLLFLISLTAFFFSNAQQNSPFSRYGLGDIIPSQNIVNRAMGGISSMYAGSQNVNFSNPASYSLFSVVNYDIGITLDSRTLQNENNALKYNAINLSPSYVALGLPLNRKKKLGIAFGIKPVTQVGYNVYENIRKQQDSILYVYEGDGGLYQGFVGIGKEWGKFSDWGKLSVGLNTGYYFGRKELSTKTVLIDSVLTYKSISADKTSYNHAFLNIGLQYEDSINKNTSFRFGFSGNLKQKLNARKTVSRETYTFDFNENLLTIDSIYNSGEAAGTIILPTSYTAGVSINKYTIDKLGNRYDKSMLGLEYQTSKWSQYRNFGEADRLVDNWQIRVGGQLTPDILNMKSYWSWVTYRAGFYFGKDAVNADGKTLPVYGFTLGAGFPVRKYRSYDYQSSIINTTFEMGKRGNSNNNITESFYRLSISLNLSDLWFQKRKYD